MKQTSLLAVIVFLLAETAAADALSDLRTVLARFPGVSPFAVAATVEVKGDSHDVAGSRSGTSKFEVTTSADGLLIRVPEPELRAAAREARAKKDDPNMKTPTRTAMAALTVFDVIDPLNAAAMLLNDLDEATLVGQSSSPWHGRAATLLTISVKATLAGTSRFVNKPKIDLRVWLDGNGIPIAAERDSNYSATFVVVTASNSRTERWEFATAGDRLYAARAEEVDRASAVGKNFTTSRTLTLVPPSRSPRNAR